MCISSSYDACRCLRGRRAARCCGCRRRRPRPARSGGSRRRRLLAAGRVAGEGDAGAGVRPEVAEDHGADVDGRAEVAGDALLTAVELGAVGVPRVEDRADGEVHLLAGLLREVPAGLLGDDVLEPADEGLQVGRVQVDVDAYALGPLGLLQRLLEELAVHAEHGLAEHLNEAAVGVPGEALVAGLGGEAGNRRVGQADVQHRVHHAGHRELRPGTHRHEKGVVGLAELLAHGGFERFEVLGDLGTQCRGLLAALQVDLARLGGDGEPRRNGKPQVGHLGEVGTFAAEEVLEVLVALGEVVDELRRLGRGYVGILCFRHGTLSSPRSALTARNIPRSKVSGYVHSVDIRP